MMAHESARRELTAMVTVMRGPRRRWWGSAAAAVTMASVWGEPLAQPSLQRRGAGPAPGEASGHGHVGADRRAPWLDQQAATAAGAWAAASAARACTARKLGRICELSSLTHTWRSSPVDGVLSLCTIGRSPAATASPANEGLLSLNTVRPISESAPVFGCDLNEGWGGGHEL